MNAFKRMAIRLKKNFPKLKFIITTDALYASEPFIKICLDNHWNYIFRFKSDNLKTINEDFDGIIEIEESNIQKNNIFDITHMCSLNYNAMKARYLFIQIAHTIRQLLDLGSNTVISFQEKNKRNKLLNPKRAYFHTINLIENKNFQLRFDKLII